MTRSRWIVVAVAAACLLVAVVIGPITPRLARIEGMAMAPTLDDQDRVFINQWAYAVSPPRRGDVVALRYPLNQRKTFVKRVIAVGGDTIRIESGRVYVNEQPLDEGYVAPEARSRDTLASQVIPAGHYFVMGDRRNNSSDSRHWGLVRADLITGRVAVRWWPSFGTLD